MTHYIYYFRGHDRIKIEGEIVDYTPDGKRVHIEFEDGDGITVELAHLYDFDEIQFEAKRYVSCLDNATRFAKNGWDGAVQVENNIAHEIRDQWSGHAIDLFDYAVDKLRREQYDQKQAEQVEESEGNKSVHFRHGETVNGWTVICANFAADYALENDRYQIGIRTEAGYGRNYFKIMWVRNKQTGRDYFAQRFHTKHIADMAAVSAELFFRFKVENYQAELEVM